MERGADKLVTNPTVVSQPTKEGAVLLEITTGECFELNQIGAEIWAVLAKQEPLADLITALARRYGQPASTVEADTHALIAELRARGLVTPDDRR